MSGAVEAYADDVVTRVSATGTRAAEAIRAQGNSVADQLAGASAVISGAVGAYADDVVGRVGASGAQAVEAIRFVGDSVADRLADASAATTRRRSDVCGRRCQSRQRERGAGRRGDPLPWQLGRRPARRGVRGDARAVDAYAGEVVGRVSASGAQAVSIRAQGTRSPADLPTLRV